MTAERNASICKDYQDGASLYDLGQKYQLSRQRIHQILQTAGIPIRPRVFQQGDRDTFLGANINEGTKNALTELAQKKGVSVSALTDQALQEMLQREQQKIA